MKQNIYDRIIANEGVLGVAVVDAKAEDLSEVQGSRTHLLTSAIALARLAKDEDFVSILVGEKGPTQSKLVACLWPDYHVAVEVIPGHKVMKSLQRILRRTGVRWGGLEVQSRRCQTAPPAASFDAPKTEPSSPFPEGEASSTGPSQGDR